MADTLLSLGAGMAYAGGDTQAVFFPLVLGPIRRGPLRFAIAWQVVSVRTAAEHAFGLGDPKVFARLRIVEAPRLALRVEGAARIPSAQPRLYPCASGGQEIELGGSLGVPRLLGLGAGAGRIWSEPPSRSPLRSSDLPHATHVWALVSRGARSLVLSARGDLLFLEGGGRRRLVEASLTRLDARGFHVALSVGLELGPDRDRVFDRVAGLRFATALR